MGAMPDRLVLRDLLNEEGTKWSLPLDAVPAKGRFLQGAKEAKAAGLQLWHSKEKGLHLLLPNGRVLLMRDISQACATILGYDIGSW